MRAAWCSPAEGSRSMTDPRRLAEAVAQALDDTTLLIGGDQQRDATSRDDSLLIGVRQAGDLRWRLDVAVEQRDRPRLPCRQQIAPYIG